ncbi:hypothetical protein OU787_25685 [Kitasatospora sp. YST-16]|uniref:hypothetical protein n=1 Tax=Kitasatospora sp. YST-16 TaxID=2998080 RepID=UPI002283E29B|nr:hypothetical protein [Kitasatospora sp. YST-16]WAL74588.1 hypothetical protein OU787_25685 [Kitasatospora sp. YST-16]WNW40646.1 hypothetical protein RKE32_25620 [Streptomyces sp. Li-HN-5-13]
MLPAAPLRSDVLVRPARLADGFDLPFHLASEHGWYRPVEAPPALVLISPQEELALNRQHQQWTLTSTAGWTVRFCDRVPAEVPYALVTAAQEAEAGPAADAAPITGDRATVLLLASGWSGFNRDGYRLVAAPDRRAALSWPKSAPYSGPALTAAAETGAVWTVQFSHNAPDHLLTVSTAALLRAAARKPEQIPERFRGLIRADPRRTGRGDGDQAARSVAARLHGSASHPALRQIPPPTPPSAPLHYSPTGPARSRPR